MKKVSGLDSLRFVLAFVVLLGHGAMPHITSEVERFLSAIMN